MYAVPADCPLTGKELEVLQLLADGLTYAAIARKLGRSISTVRSHIHNIHDKLGVADRAQAVIVAANRHWVEAAVGDANVRLLLRIEQSINELCRLLDKRSTLTQPQKELLSAFDAVLYAREDDEYVTARQAMDECLTGVADEAGIVVGVRRKRDLVELLAGYVVNQRHVNIQRQRQRSTETRKMAA